MTTIKTIAFILMAQSISSNLIAFDTLSVKSANKKARPGDGKDKYNAKAKNGESLKGYFYRIYGANTIPAKDIKFKGPFKRKKVKKFLKRCQKNNGDITEKYTEAKVKEAVIVVGNFGGSMFIHHITLNTKVACLVNNKIIDTQKWSAVYLDSDRRPIPKNLASRSMNLYVDYDNCHSDDRAYLEVGEYSIHYDQNSKCTADVFEVKE